MTIELFAFVCGLWIYLLQWSVFHTLEIKILMSICTIIILSLCMKQVWRVGGLTIVLPTSKGLKIMLDI